jgi:hypothetical protein
MYRGADFDDAANDEVKRHRSTEEIRSFYEKLQSERTADEQQVAALALVDEHVNGAGQTRHKERIPASIRDCGRFGSGDQNGGSGFRRPDRAGFMRRLVWISERSRVPTLPPQAVGAEDV